MGLGLGTPLSWLVNSMCQSLPVRPRMHRRSHVACEPTKMVKTQNVNVKADSCSDLTYWSGYSHRGRQEPFSAHDLHCTDQVTAIAIHRAPMLRYAQTRCSGPGRNCLGKPVQFT